MTRSSLQAIKNLFLSFSLIATATLFGCGSNNEQTSSPPISTTTEQTSGPPNSAPSSPAKPPIKDAEGATMLFGIPFLRLDFLVPGGLGLIGISALLLARQALRTSDEAFSNQEQACIKMDAMLERMVSVERRLKELGDGLQKVDEEYKREDNNLLKRINRIDSPPHSQWPHNTDQPNPGNPTPPSTRMASTALPPLDELASLYTQSSPSFVIPAPASEPVQPPAPTGPSKLALIDALNSGNRQQLKAAAKAELNITRDYESALFSGRSMPAELEEVNAGGSYWLVELDGKHWLFPTDKTLRGIAEMGQDKGMYILEKQTVAQNQLIEPALLERTGSTWSLSSTGIIAVP